jgi:hypothetical protein
MPDKAEMGEKAQCTGVYMSILSPFPTPHGAARGFFNSLLVPDITSNQSAILLSNSTPCELHPYLQEWGANV